MSYRLLVLPDLPVMRPEVLRRIRELVAEGGAVLGPPPSASPSLQGYPACDEQVRAMAAEMWADCDGRKVTQVRHRQGFVFRGVDVKSALATLGVSADVEGLDHKRFPWLHRTSPEGEVYFISHQGDQAATMTPSFRVTELRPELWDAVTGERRLLTDYRFEDGRTVVPLEFAPRQAMFIVFREKADAPTETSRNFLPPTVVSELTGSWTVEFDPRWGGPQSVVFNTLEDWTQRPEEGIRYYSGTASYHKRFDLPDGITGRKLYLDLGTVRNMARVRLNGVDLGLAWAFPWRVEVTRAVKPVGNELVVDVINTWANRIIGDLRLPEAKRRTRMTYPHHQPDSPLLPAGLLGPVRLTTE